MDTRFVVGLILAWGVLTIGGYAIWHRLNA